MEAKIDHEVKSWTWLFQKAKDGSKTSDVRDKTERDYKVGDVMLMREFDQQKGTYTGDSIKVRITHIISNDTPCAMSSNGLAKNLCILSIRKFDE